MNPYKVVKIVFTILGIILLTISGLIYYQKCVFNKNAINTTGEVIKVTKHGENYSHLLKFTSKNKEYKFYGMNSFPPQYSVGEKVEVLYNPNNPKGATIADFSKNWGILIIIGGLGLIFFGIGIGIFLFESFKKSIGNIPNFRRNAILYILISVGLILLTISSIITYPKLEFERKAQTGTGEIVQYIYRIVDETDIYFPIIKFEFSGKVYEFCGTTATKTPEYHIGEKVGILFEKDNPYNAEIKSFWRVWGAFIVIGGIGLMFIILPILYI